MFEEFNERKLKELHDSNELYYELAIQILSHLNVPITPLSVEEEMITLESLAEDENIKEIMESSSRERIACIMLQTGDLSDDDYRRLLAMGLLSEEVIKEINSGSTKTYQRNAKADIKAPILNIKDKSIEEKVALCVKDGIYSKIEVQKMINNGLIDQDRLESYYQIHGVNRHENKSLNGVFKPLMSFDGVRLSNDLVIGGVSSDGIIENVDDEANKQIYIF